MPAWLRGGGQTRCALGLVGRRRSLAGGALGLSTAPVRGPAVHLCVALATAIAGGLHRCVSGLGSPAAGQGNRL